MDLAIPDVARFLETYAPNELERLAEEYPEARAQLRPTGVVLGTEDRRPIEDAVNSMLVSIGKTSRAAISKVDNQLKAARRLELIGAILAVSSSSGVVTSALVFESPVLTAILGAGALGANLVPLVVNWLRGSTTGGNVAARLIEVREIAWDAQLLQAEVRRSGNAADWTRVVNTANELGRRAYIALNELGFNQAIEPV